MTQEERVLRHLEDRGSITSLDAFRDYGITRLAACVWVLRHKRGLNIEGETETHKNRYGEKVHYSRYRLGA